MEFLKSLGRENPALSAKNRRPGLRVFAAARRAPGGIG
jgi:hypothetical protein